MQLDQDGVCMGCRIHEEKDQINWQKRFDELKTLIEINRKNQTASNFDCIVPVSGGADSYFIVDIVKNELGLNPLLVNYNSQFNTKVGIRNLANLTTVFDCELLTSTLSPSLLKKITKSTLEKYGSMYWQVLAGQLTFPVQTAVKFRVPLIIWGVQPWSEQTGMFSHLDSAEMTERCRLEHGLMGISAEDLIDDEYDISRSDIQPFVYPYDHEIESVGVRGIYLSNYIRWDSKQQHEKMIEKYGYEPAEQQRTFNSYEDVHCFHSAGVHDYIKFIKFGYSKVTDHSVREIRLGRMTREQAIIEIKTYSEIIPNDLDTFLNWLEITEQEFFDCVWDRRDPSIWAKNNSNEWILLDSIEQHEFDIGIDDVRLPLRGVYEYRKNLEIHPIEPESNYILMGRSYMDKYNYGAIVDRPKGAPTNRTWEEKSLDLGAE